MATRKNTSGKVVGEPPAASARADEANPPAKRDQPEEKGRLQKIKDGIDDSVDAWVERNGYSQGSMMAGAAAKAFNELLTPTALWELIPVGKAFKLAKKGGEAVGLVKKAENAAEAATDAGRAGGKKPPGGKVKAKKKMKCGEYGKYGDLKKKTGDGEFDRDHIPSKAALKARAAELKGDKLTPKEMKAIDNAADAVAIPRQAHIDISPTHGTKNIKLAPKDAEDLAGAARRDIEAMLKEIESYDKDGGCKKAYQKASRRVLRKSNADFDKWLGETLEGAAKK